MRYQWFSAKKWLSNPRNIKKLRPLVQGLFALFIIYLGYRFYLFYSWALGNRETYVPRPPGVEGFLPISALMGLKKLVLTGKYDMVHPAGLTILMAVLTISLVFRKGFCGWICPIGFLSNFLERIGLTFKVTIPVKRWVGVILGIPKYLLLAFFVNAVFFQMDIKAIDAFLNAPYNFAVDAKMLKFFLEPSSLTIKVLLGLLVISLFIRNFWCRYLCPYGALLGIVSFLSPTRIVRDKDLCTNCKLCTVVCPAGIKVHQKIQVLDPDCIGCEECVAVCPKKGSLTVRFAGRKAKPYLIATGIVTVFLGFWILGRLTGHWTSAITPETFRKYYQIMDMLTHPGM